MAVIAARIISALANFSVNRLMMRDGAARPSPGNSLMRYATLAVGILAANAALLEALMTLGVHLAAAKVLTEAVLIPVSFAVQRLWVFLPARTPQREEHTAPELQLSKLSGASVEEEYTGRRY